MSGSLPQRIVRRLDQRMPTLAAAIATPRVRGTESVQHDLGTVYRRSGGEPRALIVLFSSIPATSKWLAGKLALRLDARVLVARAPGATMGTSGTAHSSGARSAAAADLIARATRDFGDPASGIAVVGEGGACLRAIDACQGGGVARLALVYPTGIRRVAATGDVVSNLPTTLIQARGDGAGRAEIDSIDRALRAAGVAVRETEYTGVDDDWARLPRVSRGSARALDDLVAFLERGIGTASTFEVIPGWDLH